MNFKNILHENWILWRNKCQRRSTSTAHILPPTLRALPPLQLVLLLLLGPSELVLGSYGSKTKLGATFMEVLVVVVLAFVEGAVFVLFVLVVVVLMALFCSWMGTLLVLKVAEVVDVGPLLLDVSLFFVVTITTDIMLSLAHSCTCFSSSLPSLLCLRFPSSFLIAFLPQWASRSQRFWLIF